MDITAETAARISVILLYVPAVWLAYRWLMPRLSPTAKLLASLMLIAQVLAIGVALFIQPPSSYQERLWHLDREWNIPSTLASTQLALGGGVALATAWLSKAQPAWKRFYLLGIGFVFLNLALDEYFEAHEFTKRWVTYFAVIGGILVAATLVVALRSPRRAQIWHLCFLVGLSMSAGGGLLLETQCGRQVFLAIGQCSNHYYLEEPLEFLGFWLTLVAILGQFSMLSPSPSVRVQRWLFAYPALWLLLLSLPEAIHHVESYTGRSIAAAVEFESGIHLHGHLMKRGNRDLHLFLSPGRLDFLGLGFSELGYSIHLIDQVSGDSVYSRDKYAHHRYLLLGPGSFFTYRQKIGISLPAQTPVNRAYWIVLTLWRKEGDKYRRERILASDHALLNDTQVILSELAVPSVSSSVSSGSDSLAAFDNGFVLDAVETPERVRAGESLSIDFSWRSNVDGSVDHAQFLHLGHADSGNWWTYDQMPLGPRLPTRLWYKGLADSETWQVPLPEDLETGFYNVFTGLYQMSDLERIPAKGADGSYFLDARVSLGSLIIE